MLRAAGLARRYGSRTLFEGVDLAVVRGDRLGLVGANGAGKTTLLRMLAGLDTADEGRVELIRGLRVGYLRQEIDPASERTVIDETRTAQAALTRLEADLAALEAEIAAAGTHIPEALAARYQRQRDRFEALGGYRAEADLRSTLSGLGLGPERWPQPLRALSGGWIMRVELAKLLLARPDVLLLDEPTNHLDLPSIDWFEGVLRDWPGAVVLVSHDRTLLDRQATAIAELEAGSIHRYSGNYDAYLTQKRERQAAAAGRVRNLERQIAHNARFVERFGVKASKARQAQSKRKVVERLSRERDSVAAAAAEPSGRAMRFRFPVAARSGDVVLRLEEIRKVYGPLHVYDALDLEIRRGERIALVGPNGAGKSTLLRLCAGVLEPDGGTREPGHNVRVGFYAQHQLEALDPERSVLGELERASTLAEIPRLRGLAGAFLFSGQDVEKRVSVLSGGAKARLALAKLLLARANLLVLDEPTNHLDLRAREVLLEALRAFGGTLLFISHDRTLINALATRVLEITRGEPCSRVRSFAGNYDEYQEQLRRGALREREAARGGAERSAEPPPVQPSEPRSAGRRPARRKRSFTLERLRSQAGELEQAISEAEAELERLGWLTADPEVARDGDRMRELVSERRALEQRQSELYQSWERLATELDALQARD